MTAELGTLVLGWVTTHVWGMVLSISALVAGTLL